MAIYFGLNIGIFLRFEILLKTKQNGGKSAHGTVFLNTRSRSHDMIVQLLKRINSTEHSYPTHFDRSITLLKIETLYFCENS